MADARHSERKAKAKHTPRKKDAKYPLWATLRGSAIFWLVAVTVFTVGVVFLMLWLAKLLSGN
jgi:uncharacterized membrane protein